MNRREIFPVFGAGAALSLAAGTTPAVASGVSPALAAAIEAHRTTIRHDETLYGGDCAPIVDAAALEASDAAIGAAFLALMSAPCLTPADAEAKAAHLLGGSIGLRDHGSPNELLSLLTPDWEDPHDPEGPSSRSCGR